MRYGEVVLGRQNITLTMTQQGATEILLNNGVANRSFAISNTHTQTHNTNSNTHKKTHTDTHRHTQYKLKHTTMQTHKLKRTEG